MLAAQNMSHIIFTAAKKNKHYFLCLNDSEGEMKTLRFNMATAYMC